MSRYRFGIQSQILLQFVSIELLIYSLIEFGSKICNIYVIRFYINLSSIGETPPYTKNKDLCVGNAIKSRLPGYSGDECYIINIRLRGISVMENHSICFHKACLSMESVSSILL